MSFSTIFFLSILTSIALIFDCAGSSLLCRLFCSCGKQGPLSSCGALASYRRAAASVVASVVRASSVVEHRLWGAWASVVVAHRFNSWSLWTLEGSSFGSYGVQA